MRSIFCGNFDYDARESDLERLFRKYGRVERIDMKSGFAFIFMEDERDAEDAIRALDMKEFGRKGRRLRVEWTKQQDRGIRKPMASKRNTRPSKTLFVINFDPINTRTRDLERHFDPYGKIENVRIRKNFAFIQFGLQEDATRALEATDSSKLMDHVISVEYSVQDDDKKNGYNPRDGPYEGGRDRGRSPSPYRRERASPDYGRRDPSPYKSERPSPDYGRRRSPSPARKVRENPDYTRDNVRIRSGSPYRRNKASPDNIRIRSRSPYRRDMVIPSGGRAGSPYRRDKVSPGRIRSHSPYEKERVRAGSDQDQDLSPSRSPYGRQIVRPDNQRDRSVSLEEGERVNGRDSSTSPYRRKRTSLDHDNGRSSSTYQKEKDNTNDDHPDGSPNIRSARVDSPISEGDNSPAHQRYHSQSPPPMLERSPSD